MQARLETNRFPAAAAFAVVLAVVAAFLLSAGAGYAIKALSVSAPAALNAPTVQPVVQDGPQSDLTRALPNRSILAAPGGTQSDLTRVLPKPPIVQGGPDSDLTRALPGQQSTGSTGFDTCTRLVHKVC
jgi:hypothetical protein